MSRAICLYAGSFDPVTNGHLSLIRRAASRFDRVFVAVMRNPAKQGAFTVGERLAMLAEVCAPYGNVRVLAGEGLTAALAAQLNANVLLRGVRGMQDLESELTMARVNRRLNPGLETIFLPPEEGCEDVSSSLVRELASLGADFSAYVPPQVRDRIVNKYSKGGTGNG